jgi:deoxycytidylate deaminase
MKPVSIQQEKNPRNPKTQDSAGANQSIKNTLEDRSSQELVIGFAGPIGCGISLVVSETKQVLEAIGYEVHVIKLSELIQKRIDDNTIQVNRTDAQKSAKVRRILTLQDGGNELRGRSSSYLAELAIREIVVKRGEQSQKNNHEGEIENYVPQRTAYLIDQLKHPDEVAFLRIVYRKLFHLIGVISVSEKRKLRLTSIEQIDASEISELMERDRKQEDDNGQQLDKALKLADFFLSTDAGTTGALQKKLKRFIGLLHGENGISPSIQEYGMYAAYSAGLRSSCLSRQVGAAISDPEGKIVSTGCNDVPRSGGGLYSYEDGTNDRRCAHREEQICFNDREKILHKSEIRRVVETLQEFLDEKQIRKISNERVEAIVNELYRATRIGDLTEFSRAVHAEMDAIISLARTGTPGIATFSLFTTTFPCHSCARHIVAAGISKVYYIEPYEKSLAQKLHSDAIQFDTEDDEVRGENCSTDGHPSLVKFIHFEGVAPSQYLNFFQMKNRKDVQTGKVIKVMPVAAGKTVGEYLDDYRSFEAKVVDKLQQEN